LYEHGGLHNVVGVSIDFASI